MRTGGFGRKVTCGSGAFGVSEVAALIFLPIVLLSLLSACSEESVKEELVMGSAGKEEEEEEEGEGEEAVKYF